MSATYERFHLTQLASLVVPPFHTFWNDTSGADTKQSTNDKRGDALVVRAVNQPSNISTPQFVLLRQYVTGPLKAGTLQGSGTAFRTSIRAKKTGGDPYEVWYLQFSVWTVAADGTRKSRLTVLQHPPLSGNPSPALTTTLQTRLNAPGQASSSFPVTIAAGDRLCFDFGYSVGKLSGHSGDPAGGGAGQIEFGSPNAADLPYVNDSTTSGAPWVEFQHLGAAFFDRVQGPSSTYTKPMAAVNRPSTVNYPSVAAVGTEGNAGFLNE